MIFSSLPYLDIHILWEFLTRVVCFINWMAFLCTHSQIDFSQIPIFLCVWSSQHLHLHLRIVSFTLVSLFLFVFLWPTSFQSSCSFINPEHRTRAITRARLSTAYEQCGAWHKNNPEQSCRRALIIATPQLLFRIKWDCQGLVLLKMYVMECWKCASKLC